MEYLEIGEIREIVGIKVQCIAIDQDWSDHSDDVCKYHKCVFEGCICDHMACCAEERQDKNTVYFKEIN